MMKKIKEQNENTYDFYVQTKRDQFFKLHDEEIGRLIGEDGNIRAEFAELVSACPICGCVEYEFQFKKQGFEFKQCGNDLCGHIYVDPQINEAALVDAYSGDGRSASDLWMDVMLSEANQNYDRRKYNLGIDAIEEHIASEANGPRRVLDVGCSIGLFLDVARSREWETIGLELNDRAVNHACNVLKLDVRKKLLKDAELPHDSFDAVTLWGVIEHLKDPVTAIKEAVRLLKPGGIFLTFCPNASSLVCRVIKDLATAYDGHDHPQNFTPKSILYAMERGGLENVDISFHQPDIDAVLHYVEGSHPYVKDSKLKENSSLMQMFTGPFREKAEEVVLENGLGYKMMTVNRKPIP